MSLLTRYCRECEQDRAFDQPHDGQGCCPDTIDGDCPEWACTECGAALLIGVPGPMAGMSGLRGVA